VRLILSVCEAAAVVLVGAGVALSALKPSSELVAPIRRWGILVLLAAPFVAALGVALLPRSERHSRRLYAVGAVLVAALGVWIAT
jgi:hypothetical protein